MLKVFGGRTVAVLMAGAIAAALAGGPASAAGEPNAARGGELAKRWCSTCHVIDTSGTGTAVDPAPPFPSMAGRTAEKLRIAINGPHVQMPQLNIGRRDADDLVAYIRSLGAKQ